VRPPERVDGSAVGRTESDVHAAGDRVLAIRWAYRPVFPLDQLSPRIARLNTQRAEQPPVKTLRRTKVRHPTPT
jgi:hypothetical protein